MQGVPIGFLGTAVWWVPQPGTIAQSVAHLASLSAMNRETCLFNLFSLKCISWLRLHASLQCSEPMMVDNLTVSSLYGKCSFDSYDQVI